MGYIAENARKFFHPAAINEMLSTFLPQMDGTELDVSFLFSYEIVGCSFDADCRQFFHLNIISQLFCHYHTPNTISP